ncbi:MAG: glycogen debranching enzyme, partial [Actinomycetota bacterium]|nr:glycogen debranching enzyme [Actinomycetota bacterium]
MPEIDPFSELGVRATSSGGRIRVWSANATAIELCLFDAADPARITSSVQLVKDGDNVWTADSSGLTAGARYSLRADGPTGPTHRFDPRLHLLDPYARGLVETASGRWLAQVQDGTFNWAGATKPAVPLDHTVIYEAHARGFSRLNPATPEELRGTYAGLAHESTIGYLKDLGVTSIELLPVHQFVSEQRLIRQGLSNYWGYN